MEKIVVFDLDDTLWPLNIKAYNMANVDINKMNTFILSENENITKEEQDRIMAVYNNPKLWENINYEPKALEIYKLQQLGAKVYINSNCLNDDVAAYKRSILSRDFNLPEDQIILNVSSHAKKKNMIDNMYIFADDSPFNIANSKAKYNIVPNKTWNQTIARTDIYRFNTFAEIYDFIEYILVNNL